MLWEPLGGSEEHMGIFDEYMVKFDNFSSESSRWNKNRLLNEHSSVKDPR